MSRTRRFLWNYSSNLAGQAVGMLVALLAAPLILQYLGGLRYGAFRVALDWFGYLALLEIGLAASMQPLLAGAVSRNDPISLRKVTAAGVRSYAAITLLAVVLGLLLLPFLPRLTQVAADLHDDLSRGWLILLLGMLVLPLVPFRTLLEASQKNYWIDLIGMGRTLLFALLSVAVAETGWGIRGQCLAVTLSALFAFVLQTWTALRGHPGLLRDSVRTAPDLETRQRLGHLHRASLLVAVCFQLAMTSDSILIALFLGPEAVAPLYLTQRLAVLAQMQLRNVAGTSWAALVELHTRGFHDVFNRRLVELTGLIAVLGTAVLAPIVAYNAYFLELWVGAAFDAGDLVVFIAALNALFLGVTTLWNWPLVGIGQMRRLIPITLVWTTVNVIASVLLTLALGVIGPLLGSLLAFLTTLCWYLPLLLQAEFGTSPAGLARATAAPLALGLPYGAACWWVARTHQPWGWAGLALEMTIAMLLYLLLAWALLLSRSERAELLSRIRSVR